MLLGKNAIENGSKFTDKDSYYDKIEGIFKNLNCVNKRLSFGLRNLFTNN